MNATVCTPISKHGFTRHNTKINFKNEESLVWCFIFIWFPYLVKMKHRKLNSLYRGNVYRKLNVFTKENGRKYALSM